MKFLGQYQFQIIILLTGSLLLLNPYLVLADQNTAMVGVEDDQLFAGAWFTLNPKLDWMVMLYDNSQVGFGFDYRDDSRTLKLIREWQESEIAYRTEQGAFQFSQDDDAGTNSAVLNYNWRQLGITGYYYTNEDAYQSGIFNAQWNSSVWKSLFHCGYRNDDQKLFNYSFKNGIKTKLGLWSLQVLDNSYSEGAY